MLNKTQRAALERWYSRPEVLEKASDLYQAGRHEKLEEYLHKTSLLPLGKHDQLPDYLKLDDGTPMFPNNLNPVVEEEAWKDAVDIAWQVVKEQLDISHDEIHQSIATQQQDDWQAFLDSVERRRKERGQ